VKLVGAIYLVYLGAKMLLAQRNNEGTGLDFHPGPPSLSMVFRQGFVTNVLNPKVALFFLSFLPQFVDADAPSEVLAFLFLGVLFDFNSTLWNLFVAWLSARAGTAVSERSDLRLWIDRALGSLFIYIGIRIATAER
jgi:threonine/homoserine/homoserine lactone efflux protein